MPLATAPSGVGRFGNQAGTQAPDPSPHPPQTTQARLEAEKQGQKHYPHPPWRLFAGRPPAGRLPIATPIILIWRLPDVVGTPRRSRLGGP